MGNVRTLINVTTVGDCIERAARNWPDGEVAIPTDRITYLQMNERVNHFARALMALGVQPKDNVGMLLPQTLDYMAILVAITRVGGVAVPINARYKSNELRHLLLNSDMRVLLTSFGDGTHSGFKSLVEESVPELAKGGSSALQLGELPELRNIVVFDAPVGEPYISEESFWAGAESVTDEQVWEAGRRVCLRDTACIIYTSGTTANPKGAMLTHEALVRQAETVARTRLLIDHSDKFWTPFPMFHIGGVAFALSAATVGASYIHTGDFVPDIAVKQLVAEQPTVALPGFETLWLMVLNHADFDASKLERLRLVFNIGVPERLMGMQKQLPNAPQVSGFGGTEACGFLTMGLPEDSLEARVNTTGFPLEGMDLRVVDMESGELAEANQVGEIHYRGYARFDGYYGDPERTAEVIDSQGWFHSGDMGVLDDDGRLSFAGRLKDMLKVGGENVAALEIEDYLISHPAVLMAQVVSAPDARYVEVACAYIVLKPDAKATEQEVIEYCLGKISTFKVPRYVRFVDEYPMSGTKVKKHLLRDRIANELKEAGITEAPKLYSSDGS